MEGKTQETAAAKAGMSVRSARKWQSGPLPSETTQEHRWRTRPDLFDGGGRRKIEPLLRNDPGDKLKTTTIIDCPSTSSGGGAASRAVQRIPAAHAATTITGPSTSSGEGRCMVRIRRCTSPRCIRRDGKPSSTSPTATLWGDHRRPALPASAVPADTQPLGVALRGGRRRRDLPGLAAGIAGRPLPGSGPTLSRTYRLKKKFPDSNEAQRCFYALTSANSCCVQMSSHLIVRFKPRKHSLM